MADVRLHLTGPDDDTPAFREASLRLLLRGYAVEDPTVDQDPDPAAYARHSLAQLLRCDGIALLPQWGSSRGAVLEVTVAQAIGIPVKTVEEWLHDRQ